MTATTYSEFNEKTEASQVAKAFAGEVKGKTILITGGNRGGLGFATAQALVSSTLGYESLTTKADQTIRQASHSPATLIIASRTLSKIQECIDDLNKNHSDVQYRALELDLSSQQAVRKAAAEVISWSDIPTIDIVINNAAVMGIPDRQLTPEGIELHFATNYIGHFLFTNLIMSKLIEASAKSPKCATRIVNVTTLSPTMSTMRWSDPTFEKLNKDLPESEQPAYQIHKMFGVENSENMSYVPVEGYGQSKVANFLFTIELNNRLYEQYGILSLACHPGIIRTELSRHATEESKAARAKAPPPPSHFHVKNLEAGAATTVTAALDPKLGRPEPKDGKENYGALFADCQIVGNCLKESSSNESAGRLWGISEGLVGEKFLG